jgi:hypothetical protein
VEEVAIEDVEVSKLARVAHQVLHKTKRKFSSSCSFAYKTEDCESEFKSRNRTHKALVDVHQEAVEFSSKPCVQRRATDEQALLETSSGQDSSESIHCCIIKNEL